jgi:hypothetical protein
MTVAVCLAVAVITFAHDAEKAGQLPWHLTDTYLITEAVPDLCSLSVDVYVLDDIDRRYNVFLAPIAGEIGGKSFYFGAMTHILHSGHITYFRNDGRPGYVYSRWGDRFWHSIKWIERGGDYLNWEGEGPLLSVQYKTDWEKGKYTYRLERTQSQTTWEGDFGWVTASVYCHETGRTQKVGELRHPGAKLSLDRGVSSFVEIYGSHPDPRTLPAFRVVIGNWRVNDAPLALSEVFAYYPKGSPQAAEVKPIAKFISDRECEDRPDFPRGPDALGIVIRPKPILRLPGEYPIRLPPGR